MGVRQPPNPVVAPARGKLAQFGGAGCRPRMPALAAAAAAAGTAGHSGRLTDPGVAGARQPTAARLSYWTADGAAAVGG